MITSIKKLFYGDREQEVDEMLKNHPTKSKVYKQLKLTNPEKAKKYRDFWIENGINAKIKWDGENYIDAAKIGAGVSSAFSENKLNEMKKITKKEATYYYNNQGQLHREDGPAVERADGSKVYYVNGKLHREDGPAVEEADHKAYYVNGKLHRKDGPAIEWANGSKSYYVNGQRHREDGPAIEDTNGYKSYWVNGQLHREDGPAIENADGSKEYWINGQKMSKQNFKNRKNNISSTGTQDFKYELKEQIRSIIKEIIK